MTPRLKRSIMFIIVFVLFVILIFGIGNLEKKYASEPAMTQTACMESSVLAE